MTVDMTVDEPVGSGLSYIVTHIDGQPPASLDDFTGEVQVTITKDDAPTQLIGVGGETADGVRFYQKDPTLHGRDIRVWLITDNGGTFLATPFAAF
jgi:hypothetical protein